MMSACIMHEVLYYLKQLDKPARAGKWRTQLSKERFSRAERILGYTTWATFVSTTAATFTMRNHPLMGPPDREKPPLCEGLLGEICVPYPRTHPLVFAHAGCHLHFMGKLYELCYNIGECLFVKDDNLPNLLTRDVLEDLHRDLTLWYESLIDCVQINDIKAPHTLSLQ